MLSDSDLVTNLPLTRVLEAHIASGADMTCVCTSHPGESGDTYFKLDDTGRIVTPPMISAHQRAIRA